MLQYHQPVNTVLLIITEFKLKFSKKTVGSLDIRSTNYDTHTNYLNGQLMCVGRNCWCFLVVTLEDLLGS